MNLGRPAPRRYDIGPGQTQNLRLAAGTQLYLRSGHALLAEAPQWLGETMHRLTRRLHAGQSHVLTQSGWLQLQAGDEPAVLELPQQPACGGEVQQPSPPRQARSWPTSTRHI
jgi:hypothetical protein